MFVVESTVPSILHKYPYQRISQKGETRSAQQSHGSRGGVSTSPKLRQARPHCRDLSAFSPRSKHLAYYFVEKIEASQSHRKPPHAAPPQQNRPRGSTTKKADRADTSAIRKTGKISRGRAGRSRNLLALQTRINDQRMLFYLQKK
jgi:hypothetical protein